MTATMAAKKPGKKRGPKTDRNAIEQYERKKQAAALRSREISASGRDIGDIPAVVDADARAACEIGRAHV